MARNLLRPRWRWLIGGVVVLVVSTIAVLAWLPESESVEDWLKSGKLTQAEPAWVADDTVGEVHIAGDVLLRMVFGKDEAGKPSSIEETTVYVHDLATGKKLWEVSEVDQAWVSGDKIVVANKQSATFTVRELRSGNAISEAAVEPDNYYRGYATVVGEVLLYPTEYKGSEGNLVTEIVGVDITSGVTLWSRDISDERHKSFFYNLRAADAHVDQTDVSDKMRTSVDLSFAVRGVGAQRGARLVDIETGEDLSAEHDGKSVEITPYETVVTKDGALYTETYSDPAQSIVIDVAEGEQRRYPITEYWDSFGDEVPQVAGDELFTVDAESRVKVIDTASGKTRWRSKGMIRPVAYGGGIVLGKVFADDTTGLRATDIDSGKTLWTRDGLPTGIQQDDIPTIAGGDLVTDNPVNQTGEEVVDEFRTVQVFDLNTGEGKWQIDEATLLDFNDQYYVFSIRKDAGTRLAVIERN